MRIFFFTLLVISFSLSASVDAKLENKKKELNKEARNYEKYTEKINDIADSIIKYNKNIENYNNKIKSIDKILSKNRVSYELKKKELKKIQKKEDELVETKKDIEQKLITLIAKDLSISIVLNSKSASSTMDLIKEEIFFVIGNITRKEIQNLKQSLSKTQSKLEAKRDAILKIKKYIDSLDNKKLRQMTLIKSKENLIKKSNKRKEKYKKRLVSIIAKQNSIKKIIEQLVFQKDNAQIKSSNRAIEDDLKLDVRRIGTSYQKIKTIRYVGKKTIAPINNFKITQKFGTYFDPIYKIKIFNEAVILKSRYLHAKVKSVLDGKIVFMGENPLLGKVLIIEHQAKMHTIYGYLSQFAPNIKVGSRVKRGTIIGRVYDELSFEVTKKNYHINPLELIRTK